MRARVYDGLLRELEGAKIRPPPGRRLAAVLSSLASARAGSAPELIRFHEALLFLRAYSPDGLIFPYIDTEGNI